MGDLPGHGRREDWTEQATRNLQAEEVPIGTVLPGEQLPARGMALPQDSGRWLTHTSCPRHDAENPTTTDVRLADRLSSTLQFAPQRPASSFCTRQGDGPPVPVQKQYHVADATDPLPGPTLDGHDTVQPASEPDRTDR